MKVFICIKLSKQKQIQTRALIHAIAHFSALYLGPWSDQGRKPTLLLPFIGHLISGIFPVLVVYFEVTQSNIILGFLEPFLIRIFILPKSWPPTVLYAANIYNFFGGYTLLVIAMNGYVGDVTTAK